MTVSSAVISIALAMFPATASEAPVAVTEPGLSLQAFVEGDGPPLVMLGGGTFGAAGFAPHAQTLAQDFRVVRLQTLNLERGQSHRPLPSGYSVKMESVAVTRALDLLGIKGAVDLVGWSFGGLVALDFALDHQDRVHTLTLSEPPAFWAVAPEELRATPDMLAMYELTKELGPETEPTDAQYTRFLCALGKCGAKPPVEGQPGWEEWEMRRSAMRGLSVVPNHTDSTERLKAFQRPVLILTGSDTVAFHRRINDILAASFPLVERAELAGGHTAPVTAREDFLAKLRAFLLRHRANSETAGTAQKEAAVTLRASGAFDVKLTPQATEDDALGRMSLDKQFHGDLEATSKGEMLSAMGGVQGSAGYVAIEKVTGTLKGRSGTFVLQHSGTMTRGTPQLTITVVPDSGTGQLEGLAGTMTIEIADGKHSYGFEYTLPGAP